MWVMKETLMDVSSRGGLTAKFCVISSLWAKRLFLYGGQPGGLSQLINNNVSQRLSAGISGQHED